LRLGEIVKPARTPRVVACLCVAVLATACASAGSTLSTGPKGSSSSPHSGPAVSASARIVYSVRNDTHDPPWALTGGDGDGAWSWDVGTRSTLDYVSALTHRERMYRLAAGCCGGGVRGYTGLTVGPNGTVWGVLNLSLLRLDPGSGRFSVTALPTPPRTAGAPSTGLRTGQSFADLVSVSADDKELVVGFEEAAALVRYSLTGGIPARESMIAMPNGYFALDIGILSDDTSQDGRGAAGLGGGCVGRAWAGGTTNRDYLNRTRLSGYI